MLEFSPNVRLTEVSLAKAGQHSQHAVGNAGNVSALRHTVARMEARVRVPSVMLGWKKGCYQVR